MAARSILKLGALEAQKTAFFMCDIQETFRPHVKHFGEVVKVANKMVSIIFNYVTDIADSISVITIGTKNAYLYEHRQERLKSCVVDKWLD